MQRQRGRGTHATIDALIFGAILAYFYHYRRADFVSLALRMRGPLLIFGVAALSYPSWTPYISNNPFSYTVGFSVLYLGAGALVAALVAGGVPDNIIVKGMAKIGTYSYSIYLWHMVVVLWIMPAVVRISPIWLSPWRFAAVYMVLAVVLGILMAMLVEWPALTLRDRLFPDAPKPRAVPLPVGNLLGVAAHQEVRKSGPMTAGA